MLRSALNTHMAFDVSCNTNENFRYTENEVLYHSWLCLCLFPRPATSLRRTISVHLYKACVVFILRKCACPLFIKINHLAWGNWLDPPGRPSAPTTLFLLRISYSVCPESDLVRHSANPPQAALHPNFSNFSSTLPKLSF